jgi:alpha-glucosidase
MRPFARLIRLLLAPFALLAAATVRAQPVAEAIGDGLVRFWPDSAASRSAPPSLALVEAFPALGPAPAGWRVTPRFTRQAGGRIIRIAHERGTSYYGTGMVPGPLERTGRRTVCWNTDAYGYHGQSESLYQSHPWVLAIRGDGTSFGVLADTPGRIVVDLADGIEFRAQGPAFPVIVIEGDRPETVLSRLARLVGHMPLPPRWALGYQQCRYSYMTADEARTIAGEFRDRRLPADVLWLDIDYKDGNRAFTFNPRTFPDPPGLTRDLRALGFRSVWILDPHLRQETGYAPYDEGTRADFWVRTATGEPFVGKVWPGACVFPDFTRAAVRQWWGRLTAEFVAQTGAAGIWNDMNEPAVFETANKSMPETNRHDADPALGGPGLHARYHNVYGMLMARATFEGLRGAFPERRPFVLSRANFIGGHRYAAAWTGDNRANLEHLTMAVPMALNLGLSGQPFSGPDIGGYAEPLTGDEFAAWIGVGALLPFSRGHTEKGNIRKEPWSFGPRIEALARRALETRYRLLPYLYTVFEEAARTGVPVARPACFADPRAAWLRQNAHEFLLGADVLVTQQWGDLARGRVALADQTDRWLPVQPVAGAPDPALPRLAVRAGAVVPLGPVMQWSDERPLDAVELVVALDDRGRAEGVLYEDAGDGYGHTRGEWLRTRFTAERIGDRVRVSKRREGAWSEPVTRTYTVTVLGAAPGVRVEGP